MFAITGVPEWFSRLPAAGQGSRATVTAVAYTKAFVRGDKYTLSGMFCQCFAF